jgi:SWI/SNF-related matrix-associated actin-dependent regulator 1 of chromatin subfamily A
VIAFLSVLKFQRNEHRPHLVVAPASLLENWQRELKFWSPNLRTVLYHGNDREKVRV